MNKKTKLWLGAGIVGLGAYLLWKSKKASPALTPSAPANLVGFDTGKFYDVKGGHAGVKDQGIFTNADGFAEAAGGWNPFKRRKKSVSVEVQDLGGEFLSAAGEEKKVFKKGFVTQPSNFAGNAKVGDRMISANGMTSRFFKPEDAKFDNKGEIFKKKSPVMPSRPERPVPMRQDKPVNNFASAEGTMLNGFVPMTGF